MDEVKPIALTPAQLDAALGLPAAGCTTCAHRDWSNPYPCTNCGADEPPAEWLQREAVAAQVLDRPHPRLECTCAGRDGLCAACAP